MICSYLKLLFLILLLLLFNFLYANCIDVNFLMLFCDDCVRWNIELFGGWGDDNILLNGCLLLLLLG